MYMGETCVGPENSGVKRTMEYKVNVKPHKNAREEAYVLPFDPAELSGEVKERNNGRACMVDVQGKIRWLRKGTDKQAPMSVAEIEKLPTEFWVEVCTPRVAMTDTDKVVKITSTMEKDEKLALIKKLQEELEG